MMLQRQRCDLAYPSYFCVSTFATLVHLDCSMMRPSQLVRIDSLVRPIFDMHKAIVFFILYGLSSRLTQHKEWGHRWNEPPQT